MNTFGRIIRLTDFGESHGPAMGGIIDGLPAGFKINVKAVQHALDMRRPGNSPFTSPRQEPDRIEWLSGLDPDFVTLGSPVAFLVRNTDVRSQDYNHLNHTFRPGHADFTHLARYGMPQQPGSGRASGRQTLNRVVAGAIAEQFLSARGICLCAYVSAIGPLAMQDPYAFIPSDEQIYNNPVRCPDAALATEMQRFMQQQIIGHDSVGGRVSLICTGMPPGVGNPIYDKLTARLAYAMMGINGARGVEFGLGMRAATMTGHQAIDSYLNISSDGRLHTAHNHAGGVEGGISTGEDIHLSVAFKPTPTRPYTVTSIDHNGIPTDINARGRHDPCIAIRAVPVVKAMAALTLLDQLLSCR